jgi:O-antigen ligase
VAALIFSLPFERIPSIDLLNGQVTIRPNQVVAVLLVTLSMGVLWRRRADFIKKPRVLLVVFLFILLLGVLLAVDMSAGLRVLAATLLTCVTALTLSFVAQPKDAERYERALVWTTWVVIGFGTFQYLGDTFGLSTSLTGLAPNYVKAVFGFPRIQSTALEPLFLASFLLIPFCILSIRSLVAKKHRGVTLFAITVTIVLTVSRGAIAAAVLVTLSMLVAVIFYKNRSWRKVLRYVGILTAAMLFAYLLTFTSSLLANKSQDKKFSAEKKTEQLTQQTLNFDSQDDRTRNRTLAWQAFKQNPVIGLGPGGFDMYAKEAYAGYQQAPRVIVNNQPLELLAETGLIGAMTLLAFFGSLLYAVWQYLWPRYQKGLMSDSRTVWTAGLTVYLAAAAIQYQTFSTLYIMHIWVAIGLLMAIVLPQQLSKEGIGGKKEKQTSGKN